MQDVVTVPKDLSNVKTKVLFNLTKRQCVCFFGAGLVGVPAFFICKQYISISSSVLAMMLMMTPMFLLAMYEWNGLPLEKVVENYINVKFRGSKQRHYATENFYRQIENDRLVKNEVRKIVKARNKTQQGREKTARRKDKKNAGK